MDVLQKSDKIFNIEHVQGQWHFLPWLDHGNRFNNKSLNRWEEEDTLSSIVN